MKGQHCKGPVAPSCGLGHVGQPVAPCTPFSPVGLLSPTMLSSSMFYTPSVSLPLQPQDLFTKGITIDPQIDIQEISRRYSRNISLFSLNYNGPKPQGYPPGRQCSLSHTWDPLQPRLGQRCQAHLRGGPPLLVLADVSWDTCGRALTPLQD